MDPIYISILIQIPIYIGLFITVKKILRDDSIQKHTINKDKKALDDYWEEIEFLTKHVVSLKKQLHDTNRAKSIEESRANQIRDSYNQLVHEHYEMKKQLQKRDPKTGQFIKKNK